MPPARRADIDLDAITPRPVEVKFRGNFYQLPGAIPLETVIQAIQLYDDLQSASAAKRATPGKIKGIMNQLQSLLMELFREMNEDVPDLRFSPQELGALLAYVVAQGDASSVDVGLVSALTGKTVATVEEDKKTRPPTKRKTATTRSRSGRR